MSTPKAQIYTSGNVIDYTEPGSALVSGGTPTQISDGIVGIPPSDIALSGTGGLQVTGIIKIECDSSIGNLGDNVWYDSNGSPVGGTASSGAATTLAASGDFFLGILSADTAAADNHAYVSINEENPRLPAWPNRAHLTTAVDLTLSEATHSGMVVHVTADAGTDTKITLPIGVVGMEYIIQNDEADAGNLLQVDLNGNEVIRGANLTIAATKLALLTKATGIRGDYLHLECTVAASAWRCVEKRGIWVTS